MSTTLKRISYVEDEPDIRLIVEFALTQVGGFIVEICASGAEAIDRAPAFKPDLILLDVMMPGMDGLETLKRMQEIPELATTPIVFMTAKVMQHEVKRYLSLGAADVIAKPFDAMALPDQLRKIWEHVQQQEDAPTAQTELRALLQGLHSNLLNHIETLSRLLSESGVPGADKVVLISEALDLIHKIKGAGGSIGFPKVSSEAAALEIHLKSLGKPVTGMTSGQLEASLNLFSNLQRVVKQTTPESSTLYNVDLLRI
jgi:two-component system OmpR family response regulator